jgi:surface antigen
MTALHTDVTQAKLVTRRYRWTQLLAVGAVAAAAIVGTAGAAQAGSGLGTQVSGSGRNGSSVVSDPNRTSVMTTLSDGTAFTADCGTRGRSVKGNTVWHHITSPVNGYIADYYTNTPGFNQLMSGEATCGAPPVVTPTDPNPRPTPTPTPTNPSNPSTGTRGQTINYNEGYAGSCVFYVMDRFHQLTGVYPKAFGDALVLAKSAAQYGWTVTSTPRVDSIAIFQPGDNGAGSGTGHAAWVEQVSGSKIYVGEMNAPDPYVITHRWINSPASGVRYILPN